MANVFRPVDIDCGTNIDKVVLTLVDKKVNQNNELYRKVLLNFSVLLELSYTRRVSYTTKIRVMEVKQRNPKHPLPETVMKNTFVKWFQQRMESETSLRRHHLHF